MGTYLIYTDEDSEQVKIIGPLNESEAKGFVSGVDWVNDSALEFQGSFSSPALAQEKAASLATDTGYDLVEMGPMLLPDYDLLDRGVMPPGDI